MQTRKSPSITSPSDENSTKIVFLSQSTLPLDPNAILQQRTHPTVPSSTPHAEFLFEVKCHPIPRVDYNLDEVQLPVVRSKGVKGCIEEMSEVFGCTDYKFNFLQFWYLDVLTDCIWRAQDEFEFPEEQQKVILSWVIFVIDLIRAQNYSHEEFFEVIKETILTAAAVLEEGSGEILLPLKLIRLPSEDESGKNETPSSHQSPQSSYDSSKECKSSTSDGKNNTSTYDSVIEFAIGEETHQMVLDHEKCICSEIGESLPSSVSKLLEEQPRCDSSAANTLSNDEEEEKSDNWNYRDFYKPDTSIPSRFLPSSPSEELIALLKKKDVLLQDIGSTSKLTFLPIARSEVRTNISSDKLTDYIIFRKEPWQKSNDAECWDEESQSEILDKNVEEKSSNSGDKNNNNHNERIMKGLKNFKLMEQRVRDFSDSKVGLEEWQMREKHSDKSKSLSVEVEERKNCFHDSELEEVLSKENLKKLDEDEFLSFGVLWAIIDFIYEYFSDSFQYTLIKMALTSQPNLIIQNLNDEWHVPKCLKEDLTLRIKDMKDKYKKIQRKEEKKKKEAKKKDKKADKKKDKSDKSSKKTKDDKKSKKDDKKSKKDDKAKKKGKEKKPELTEEELLQQQQLAELEAEKLRQEMNKKFLFPLQDALQDEFFKSKFPGWENDKLTNEKGKNPKKDKKKKK